MTTPRNLTHDDLWTFKTMGDIALSPDGRRIAFVVQSTDQTKNEQQSAISLLHLDVQGHAAGPVCQLTSGVKNDRRPVWAPDSKRLLFLSDREGGKQQLWLINSDGGEAYKLTNMLNGVSDAAWSPDGQWIAFTAPVALSDDDDLLMGRKTLDEAAKLQREEEARFRLRIVTTIVYRFDGRGLLERFKQLFIMPAPDAQERTIDPATIRRLTTGYFDHNEPAWTPDSAEIGVLCNRNDERDRFVVTDLWAIDRETGDARCLTEGRLEIECYAWSPDSRSAVVVGAEDQIRAVRSLPRPHLVTRRGNEGDKVLTLTPDLDNPTYPVIRGGLGLPGPYRPVWSEDGQYVYFLVTEHGCTNVYRLDIVWRSIRRLASNEAVTGFLAALPGEQGLVLAQAQPDHFWELYRLPLRGAEEGKLEALTHLYDRQMAEFRWARTERLSYKGANGDEIDGWLLYPIGAREGVRYPLLVEIHGGPHSAYGVGMELYYHYCATQGFAVFYCNPHGSTGSGEAFMRSVIGDWGGQDYQDIMRGVDECIARGVADPERMVVSGYSYGGYMSMFIIGQTDRFKAAVPMAGISNLVSFVGTSDIGIWQAAQAKGYPWDPERAAYYRERSPLTYAPRVTTPTLFLHPENDLRCPIEQSEQFYMALQMVGKVPVKLVRVPGSSHGSRAKPSQWLEYWETMLDWFRTYVEIRPEEYTTVA